MMTTSFMLSNLVPVLSWRCHHSIVLPLHSSALQHVVDPHRSWSTLVSCAGHWSF